MHLPSETHGAINQRFVAGNPITGTRPTIWTAELCNAVVEEPANVILAAGLELDKTDNTQLLQAIQIIVEAAVSNALAGNGGGAGGGTSCTAIRDVLQQYAKVENGVLVITCPDDGGGTDPEPPPPTGSYALYTPSSATLAVSVVGEVAIASGAITLTDDATETYAIDGNLLTITGG